VRLIPKNLQYISVIDFEEKTQGLDESVPVFFNQITDKNLHHLFNYLHISPPFFTQNWNYSTHYSP
jgi:hypothetical protein